MCPKETKAGRGKDVACVVAYFSWLLSPGSLGTLADNAIHRQTCLIISSLILCLYPEGNEKTSESTCEHSSWFLSARAQMPTGMAGAVSWSVEHSLLRPSRMPQNGLLFCWGRSSWGGSEERFRLKESQRRTRRQRRKEFSADKFSWQECHSETSTGKSYLPQFTLKKILGYTTYCYYLQCTLIFDFPLYLSLSVSHCWEDFVLLWESSGTFWFFNKRAWRGTGMYVTCLQTMSQRLGPSLLCCLSYALVGRINCLGLGPWTGKIQHSLCLVKNSQHRQYVWRALGVGVWGWVANISL